MALLLGVCGALVPQPGTAQSDAYRAGLEAFVAGNYEQALEELLIVYTNLQHSPAAGRQTATLRYNLGATYYRLGRHEAAANQFRLIVDDATLGDRARFNLGLLAAQRGDRAEAEALFEGVAESAACATLRARAAAKRNAPLTVDPGDAPDVIAPD